MSNQRRRIHNLAKLQVPLRARYTNSAYYSWVGDSLGDPHAPIHFWQGGNIDCDAAYSQIGNLVGAEVAEILAFLSNAHRKGLFCDKVWGCKRTASVDEKPYEVRT